MRVVVITGASSGIGRATAHAFAAERADLVLAARGAAALAETAAECRAFGARTLVVPLDTTDADAVSGLARQAVDRFGRIDVWVNNAAVTVLGPFEEIPLEDFRRVIDVNVMGYVYGMRAALPFMRDYGSGVIVNVGSVLGVVPQPYGTAYTMSKHAVAALTASVRQELFLTGERGVRACAVLPSTIDTPLYAQAANRSGRAVRPIPPVYSPERVARVVVSVARRPRREVIVGPGGRLLAWQQKLTPGLLEKALAAWIDRTHLLHDEDAPSSAGNLYRSLTERGSVHGGWQGRRRTAVRRLAAAGVGAGALGAVVALARRR